MAEKLKKSHCRVAGHGTWCGVALDKRPSKKQLNKLRRSAGKKIIADELSVLDYEFWIDPPPPMKG